MTPGDRKMCEAWQEAAHELGFEFTTPFTVIVDGQPFTYLGLVHNFGGAKGTLVGTMSWGTGLEDHPTPEGFYLSLLNPSSYITFERENFIDTLDDWGWFGPEDKKPSWYTGKPWTT